MPDTRGDVLCPTCGLWTPPAPFCTECGAALQIGFQEAAGGGSNVFRRGNEVDQPGSPWSQSERFEPEPEDEAARSAAAGAAGAAGAPRVDHFAEVEAAAEPPWPAEPGLADASAPVDDAASGADMGAAAATAAAMSGLDEEPPPVEPKPAPKRRSRAKAAAGAAAVGAAAGAAAGATAGASTGTAAAVDDATAVAATPSPEPPPPPAAGEPPPPPAGEPPVTYAGPPRDGDDGNSGVSGIVFIAFLGLGVLALLGGAILGGVFDGPAGQASPTPSIAVSTPTPEPSVAPSASASATPSVPAPSVLPTPTPVPPADGFLARAEPCLEQPSDSTCDSSGAVNDGEVWILVSFRHGQPTDTVGVEVVNSSGTTVDSGSIGLAFCGTNTDCAGYTYFQFSDLPPGDYDVRVTRNGAEVTTTAFTVE